MKEWWANNHCYNQARISLHQWYFLETPVGSMQGSYQMRSENGDHFDAPIAPFTLAIPRSLN